MTESEKYARLLEWVKEQSRYDHVYYAPILHSIGQEARELLQELNEWSDE